MPDTLRRAELNASPQARAILEVGRKMALVEKAIVRGGCWDWVNTVFVRAGYGNAKHLVYKSKKIGPYVDSRALKGGDWIYYVNHSYGGIEHSGIFVYWVDWHNRIGVVLSYGGENRNQPGRYREYDLRNVYRITRAGSG